MPTWHASFVLQLTSSRGAGLLLHALHVKIKGIFKHLHTKHVPALQALHVDFAHLIHALRLQLQVCADCYMHIALNSLTYQSACLWQSSQAKICLSPLHLCLVRGSVLLTDERRLQREAQHTTPNQHLHAFVQELGAERRSDNMVMVTWANFHYFDFTMK